MVYHINQTRICEVSTPLYNLGNIKNFWEDIILPSGKRLHNELGNHHAMGKSTNEITIGPFSIAYCWHNQRVINRDSEHECLGHHGELTKQLWMVTTLWLWLLHSHGIFHGPNRNRWFTVLNSMVDLSMANCECHNQMVSEKNCFFPGFSERITGDFANKKPFGYGKLNNLWWYKWDEWRTYHMGVTAI